MLQYSAKYTRDSGLIMSPSELEDQYFFGTPIVSAEGVPMPKDTIAFYIRSAQQEVEKWLNIKLTRQIISEQKDFSNNDFRSWGFIRLSYMCVEPVSLNGTINNIQQIQYPKEWLSARRTSDGELYHRNLYIVPGNGGARTHSVLYSGISPHLGLLGSHQIPQYWEITYCTGFTQVPMDLKNFIGKLAAISIFHILGDLILKAGIASQSISIDGLSQSIGTTASATSSGYGSRVMGYLKDLGHQKPILESYYRGIVMTAC